jgi:hypothetical protein
VHCSNVGPAPNQVIWKFDSAVEARLADNLKQAAIEQGQWTERPEVKRALQRASWA